jgi:hypothetical protein
MRLAGNAMRPKDGSGFQEHMYGLLQDCEAQAGFSVDFPPTISQA